MKANVLFFDKKPPSEQAATKDLWIYDLRTNKRFTLKERPMVRADLDDFVASYKSGRRHEREESERFKRYPLDALLARDKVNLDIFWLKDDSLDDPLCCRHQTRSQPRWWRAWNWHSISSVVSPRRSALRVRD